MNLTTRNGQLDLPRDFNLLMERTNPLLLDRGDASEPIKLPSSSRNLVALGHPERIDRAEQYDNKLQAILQVGPVQKCGQLVLDTAHRIDGIAASFAIDNSDLYVSSKDKSLKDIFATAVEGAVNREDFGDIATAMARMNGIYNNTNGSDGYDYTIFPVAVAPYEQNEERIYQYSNEDGGTHALRYATRIVHEGDGLLSVPSGFGIAPFLKLHRMLDRLFECMGYTVTSNCFAEMPYSNLVIVHNCADCLCNPTVTLYYKDMVPSCTLSEFLGWLNAKFHAQPVVDSETRNVKIVLMEDMLSAQADIDISGKVEGCFTVQFNPTKRIVLSPTNSLEGTEPAAESFDKMVEQFGGYVEADEDEFESLEGHDPAFNDCLVLRKTTGQFYALNYDIATGKQVKDLKGTNHFVYDRKNSDETEDFSQADVMPLMLAGLTRKREVCPFIGERLYFHTTYEGQKKNDKQDIIVVQRAYNEHFANPTTGTTQDFIPYTEPQSGVTGLELGFGLTNFKLYRCFWKKYNELLLNHPTRLKGRVAYDLGEFLGIDMSTAKFCNGQTLLPVEASAVLADHFGLTDAEFLLVKDFIDGVSDTEIEPMQSNGLKWKVTDNLEEIARQLYEDEIAEPNGATQYTSFDFELNENPTPGMPSYVNEVRTIQVLATITVYYKERDIDHEGTHWVNAHQVFTNKTVTFVFTSVDTNIPYDAEVEYLESDGTQYIDTGIRPHQDVAVEIKWKNQENQTNKYLFGSGTTSSDCIRAYIGNASYWRFGGGYVSIYTTDTIMRTATMDKTKITINGTDYNYNGTVGIFSSTTSIKLFAGATGGTGISTRIYYFKAYENGILVSDLIPVRVGQVGYMYDRVSEQLIGNAGTGNFTVGLDRT